MPLRLRVVLPCLMLFAAPSVRAQQVFAVGLEGGYTMQSTGKAFGTFFDDYNEGLSGQLDRPFDGLSRMGGVHGAARFITSGEAFGATVSLGGARLRARDEARFTDGGRRTLALHVGDFNADAELGMIQGLRGLVGVTVRHATLRSERHLANGTSDDAEGPGLSGTYDGYGFNGHVGASLNLLATSGHGFFGGLRLAATYPVLRTSLALSGDLTHTDENINERTFPDRYGAQGTPADARPVRANMAGPTVSLSLTLGLGALVAW